MEQETEKTKWQSCEACGGQGGHWDQEVQDHWHWCSECDAADEHYKKRRKPIKEDMPQIKPLVWIGEGGSLVFATSAIGDFKCQFFKHANQWSVASNNWSAFHTSWFDSLVEAKAACQQEYERRVRECLE